MALSQEIAELLRLRAQLGQQKQDRWTGWLNPIQEAIRGIGQKIETRRSREDEQEFETSERLGGEAFSEKTDRWLNLQANRREALGAARGAESDRESRLFAAAESQKGRTSAEGEAQKSRELQTRLSREGDQAAMERERLRASLDSNAKASKVFEDVQQAYDQYMISGGLYLPGTATIDMEKITPEDINGLRGIVEGIVRPAVAAGDIDPMEGQAITDAFLKYLTKPEDTADRGPIPSPEATPGPVPQAPTPDEEPLYGQLELLKPRLGGEALRDLTQLLRHLEKPAPLNLAQEREARETIGTLPITPAEINRLMSLLNDLLGYRGKEPTGEEMDILGL